MNCNAKGADLSVTNLSWAPPRTRNLLENVSFSVEPGERLAIVGPNGAGKTTLLRCLFRSLKPNAGIVSIDGQDVWTTPPVQLARKVAVVLQEMPANFPFSVHDIVAMGRIPWQKGLSRWSQRDRAQTEHALEHLSLSELSNRQFSTLSGGEKQRVLVARALAQEPQLLILDEPSNHLDIRHQLEVLELLKGLGITIITTLHDINLAAGFATKAAIINHGRLIAFGAPENVLTTGLISKAFGVAVSLSPRGINTGSAFSFSLSNFNHGERS